MCESLNSAVWVPSMTVPVSVIRLNGSASIFSPGFNSSAFCTFNVLWRSIFFHLAEGEYRVVFYGDEFARKVVFQLFGDLTV